MGSKTYSILDNSATKAWYDNLTKGSYLANPTQYNWNNTIGYALTKKVGLGVPAQTTTETAPSDTTNGDTATINDSGMPNLTRNADVQALIAQNNALNLANYVSAVNEGRKAYQELFKESLKRKQALADKKVRSDRSTALANALGSLVNVFTAYGMAKKGDYAPIVADYDSTPDTELKKSIAARYALENENEGLLMQLVKDRINSEAEIAKGKYEHDVKANEAMAKAKAADNKNNLDWWKWQKSEEGHNKRSADSIAAADERARTNNLSRENAARIAAGQKIVADEKKNFSDEAAAFIATVNNGKTKTTESTNLYGTRGTITKTPYNLSPNQSKMFRKIYNSLVKSGLNQDQIDRAAEVYNHMWVRIPALESKISQNVIRGKVINGVKANKSTTKIIADIQQ